MSAPQKKKLTSGQEALNGMIASMCASCFTHPIDLLKVRLQLAGEGQVGAQKVGALRSAMTVAKTEGLIGLYNGVTGTLLRQSIYAPARFGAYDALKNMITPTDPETGKKAPMTISTRLLAGLGAGGIGAFACCPADVIMVRMQADGRLPPAERRNYKNAVDGLLRMYKTEGVKSWYTGVAPNMARAMVVTAAQIGCYEEIKIRLSTAFPNIFPDDLDKHFALTLNTHFVCSLGAGMIAVFASNPIDITKTRLMNTKPGPDGKPIYKGAIDCALKTVKNEGPLGLYKGWAPNWFRLGPQTVLMMMFAEQFKRALFN